MNAYELADAIRGCGDSSYNQDAYTMLCQQQVEIAELKNARDYWCLQYKDVFSKLERISNERCGGKDEDSSRHRNK